MFSVNMIAVDLHTFYRLPNIRPAMTERSGKIDKVTSLLYQHLVQGNEDRIETTGSLLPTHSLRHKSTPEALSWVRDLNEDGTRFFTQPLIRDSLLQLAEKHNFALPHGLLERQMFFSLCYKRHEDPLSKHPQTPRQPWIMKRRSPGK